MTIHRHTVHSHSPTLLYAAMAPFYLSLCSDVGRTVDPALLSTLEATNKATLATLEAGIENAEKNFGETEQRDALMAKAEYLCTIGDKVRGNWHKAVGYICTVCVWLVAHWWLIPSSLLILPNYKLQFLSRSQ